MNESIEIWLATRAGPERRRECWAPQRERAQISPLNRTRSHRAHSHERLLCSAPACGSSSTSQRARVCEQGAVRKKFLLYPHDLYPLIVNERENAEQKHHCQTNRTNTRNLEQWHRIFLACCDARYIWLCRSLFTFSSPPIVKACARGRAFVTMPLQRHRLSPIPGHTNCAGEHNQTNENLSMATCCKQAI